VHTPALTTIEEDEDARDVKVCDLRARLEAVEKYQHRGLGNSRMNRYDNDQWEYDGHRSDVSSRTSPQRVGLPLTGLILSSQ
jgi:hypothetical protein